MLQEKMTIPEDCVNDVRFEHVHQMPTRPDNVPSSKPRDISAKFSFYQEMEYLWSFVKNIKCIGISLW